MVVWGTIIWGGNPPYPPKCVLTFEREASAALDLQIKCEVQFCIQYEIEAGTCDPETCPENYSLRHFIPQE